jgi:hypothetical protein
VRHCFPSHILTKIAPTWASINLGVMMCIECSGEHRSLGVHISQVRSVELDDGWTDKLLEFFASVGNRAFNLVWEANVYEMGVVRLEEYPTKRFIRHQFIVRKYQQKMFMKYDLGTPPPSPQPTPATATHHTYQSLSEIQSSTTPSEPIPRAEIFKAGPLEKLSGRYMTLWQSRYLIITHDGRVFYSKSMDSAPAGSIPLQLLPSFEVTLPSPPCPSLSHRCRGTKARETDITISEFQQPQRANTKGEGLPSRLLTRLHPPPLLGSRFAVTASWPDSSSLRRSGRSAL